MQNRYYMKRGIFIILFCYSFLSQAIVKDTVLYQNDLASGNVGQEFTFLNSVYKEDVMTVRADIFGLFGIDGQVTLTISGVDLNSYDSVIVTYNIESNADIFNQWGDIKYQNYIDEYLDLEDVFIIDRYSISQVEVSDFNADSNKVTLNTNSSYSPIISCKFDSIL